MPRSVARASPHLYRATQAGTGLGPLALGGWAAAALWHSAVCFGVPMLVLAVGPGGGPAGGPLGLWETGTLGFVLVVLVVNLRLLLASRTLTAGHVLSVAGSLAALVGYLAAYSAAPPRLLSGIAPTGAMHGVAWRLAACPAAWVALGLGTAAALLPDMVVVALRAPRRGAGGGGDAEGAGLASHPPPVPIASKQGLAPLKGSKAIQLTITASAGPPLLLVRDSAPAPAAPAATTPRSSTPHTGYAFDHPGFESYFADRDAARKGPPFRQHGSASAASGGSGGGLVPWVHRGGSTALRPPSPAGQHKRRRFSAVEAIALAARGLASSSSASSSRRASRAEARGGGGGGRG